jgi:hypothetical protein
MKHGYDKSTARYVRIRNPVGYVLGHLKNGKEVTAWHGQTSIAEVTFKDPVEIVIGTDTRGEPRLAYVSSAQKKALDREQKGRETASGYIRLGIWEETVLKIIEEMDGAALDSLLEAVVARTPHNPNKKDRRREAAVRALASLKKNEYIVIKDGKVSIADDDDDLDLIEA